MKMPNIQIEPRITYGNIASVLATAAAVGYLWAATQADLNSMRQRMDHEAGIVAERRVAADGRAAQVETRMRALEIGFASATADIKSIAAMVGRIEGKIDQIYERGRAP